MVQLAWMFKNTKIIHHRHTGRLRPHEHTSYVSLAIIVLIVAVILMFFTFSEVAFGSTPYTGPEAGSVGLTGVMPAKPPTTAATITSPTNGQHFKTSPITITGTCPKDTLVEIDKNNIFAGSVPCDSNNTFNIKIDLLFGKNILIAQVYDALNQAGPASSSVTVYYDSSIPHPDPLTSINLDGIQLLLSTNAVYRGTFPGQMLNVPITILGGTPPYAVNVEWGDTENKVIPRSNNLTFNAAHVYNKPGTFGITLQATDSVQRTAFLTVAAIVNGQPSVVAGSKPLQAGKLFVLWPLLAIAATMVASFWFGEKREKRILGKNANNKPLFPTTVSTPPPSTQ